MPPAISIVMPFHNDDQYLRESLSSVLSQTLDNWELLLVDDASTDGSKSIAQEFARRDTRIRYYRLPVNGGPSVARNFAIQNAAGRFVAFLDSDDLWLPEKLERQVEFMEKFGVILSCTGYAQMREDGTDTGVVIRPPSEIKYRDMLFKNHIGCLTAMYDSSRLGRVLMPDLRKRQDYGLWLQIIRGSGPALGMPDVLARYRLRRASVSSSKLSLVSYNWRLMRDVEGLSIAASCYFVALQIVNRLRS